MRELSTEADGYENAAVNALAPAAWSRMNGRSAPNIKALIDFYGEVLRRRSELITKYPRLTYFGFFSPF